MVARLFTLRWLGVTASGVIALFCLLSGACHFESETPRFGVSLSEGDFRVAIFWRARPLSDIPEIAVLENKWRPWSVELVPFHLSFGWPEFWKEKHGAECTLPLWLVFTLVAGPTTAAWIARARPVRDDECPKCRYNLTGNISGVCPECGTKLTRSGRADARVTKAP